MDFVMWFLLNVWIPAQQCASTGGLYVPAEPQAVVICEAMLTVQGG
jgi:hypothetical protein